MMIYNSMIQIQFSQISFLEDILNLNIYYMSPKKA